MAGPAYLIEFTIKEGGLDSFKKQAAAYAEAARSGEPGTLEYQWWLLPDGSRALLKESFIDSDALMAHLANVGPSLPDLIAVAPITRAEVFGEVSAEARKALAELGAAFFEHEVGFER